MVERRRIGFIGLGNIGEGMATCLVNKGFKVTVCDLRKDVVDKLQALGAAVANSPKEAAQDSDVVISMVRDDAQTDEVVSGTNGVLEGIQRGSVFIISSTIDPTHCQSIATAGKARGISVLDAPVSGGRLAAQAGTITIMVGGDEAVYKKCHPIFEAMGKNIFYLGDIGMGEVFKIVNNVVWFGNLVSLSGGLTLGLKAGLKFERLLDIIKVSSGGSWVAQNWDLMVALDKDYNERKEASTLVLAYKEMRYGLELAKRVGVYLPLAGLVSQMEISTFFPNIPKA